MKFWILRDKVFAEKLGINTDPSAIGDLYQVRRCTRSNELVGTVTFGRTQLEVQRLMNVLLTEGDAIDMFVRIIETVFKSPIIVHEFMSFAQLYTKFKTQMVILYCDKEHPEFDRYK